MKLGFTLDEKALKDISIRDWIEKAHSLGASAIELAPDAEILPEAAYCEAAKAAAELDIVLNFHIPYFASNDYSMACFTENPSLSNAKYEQFFSILSKMAEISDDANSVIVIHGQEFGSSKDKSLQNTIDFLSYISQSLQRKKLNHRVALETLRLGSLEKVGNSRAEIMEILSKADDDRVGICLDICHDSLNYFPSSAPFDKSFYEKVIYSHIHGYDFSTSKNHISVIKSSLSFFEQIEHIKKAKPDITLNIESLSDFAGSSYLDDLFSDIELLNCFI